MRKTLKPRGNRAASASVYFNGQRATSYCHQRSGPSRLAGTYPSNSNTATCVGGGGVNARVSVRSCVRDVFAIYGNNN